MRNNKMAIVANTDFLSVYGLRALILEMAPSVDVVILPDSPTLSQSVGIYSSIFSFVSISGVSAIVVPEKSDESFLRNLLGGVLNPAMQQTILTKNGENDIVEAGNRSLASCGQRLNQQRDCRPTWYQHTYGGLSSQAYICQTGNQDCVRTYCLCVDEWNKIAFLRFIKQFFVK
jgi:hypothetical protein